MIEITEKDLSLDVKEVQALYKQQLAGTTVIHPVIGEINITGTAFKETRHFIGKRYIGIILKLKEIIETSACSGKLNPPNKVRQDGAIGFYYLTNDIKLPNKIIGICVTILVDKQGNRYYMFTFSNVKKDESYNPCRGAELNLKIDGGIIAPTHIIHENESFVKCGDTLQLGDCIILTIKEILKPSINSTLHELNKEFKKYL